MYVYIYIYMYTYMYHLSEVFVRRVTQVTGCDRLLSIQDLLSFTTEGGVLVLGVKCRMYRQGPGDGTGWCFLSQNPDRFSISLNL